MKKVVLALTLLVVLAAPAAAFDGKPVIPDERTKIEALKLGYMLNNNSMVRWGSIDLTVFPSVAKSIRTIPITPKKDTK